VTLVSRVTPLHGLSSLPSLVYTVYRWFPEGKVVFVAPTKLLVAQQVEACHKTCGIPGSDTVELTGKNLKSFRSKAVSVDV
jgi:ATP-dependent DNA helicase MPH1